MQSSDMTSTFCGYAHQTPGWDYGQASPSARRLQTGQMNPAPADTLHTPSILAADTKKKVLRGKRGFQSSRLAQQTLGVCPGLLSTSFTPSSIQQDPTSGSTQPPGGSSENLQSAAPMSDHRASSYQSEHSPRWSNNQFTQSNKVPHPPDHSSPAIDFNSQSPDQTLVTEYDSAQSSPLTSIHDGGSQLYMCTSKTNPLPSYCPPQIFSASPASPNPTAQPDTGYNPNIAPEVLEVPNNAPPVQCLGNNEARYYNYSPPCTGVISPSNNDLGVSPTPTTQPLFCGIFHGEPDELTTLQPSQRYMVPFDTDPNANTIDSEEWTFISDGSMSEGQSQSSFPGILAPIAMRISSQLGVGLDLERKRGWVVFPGPAPRNVGS
ncbi:hypothetical protein BD779DRAFT_1471819 [Infundibulicybe gibba]|nr:hypothetical protein BD779DRAFT_1471819 [Infundibulicybe gibba]